ncbi:thiazole biosynthesis adenylyltransferase ThiF [Synergistales bacterium]|nr:thiazole biosynthesis adenylyltransferase ThiF [Synergistales bacterium]
MPKELKRYARHVVLKKIGVAGQKKLLASSVLLIGAGGLGTPAAMYLAAMGVGRIGIADGDDIELSNLQRQVMYGMSDVGEGKARTAAAFLRNMNPDVTPELHETYIDKGNIGGIIAGYDFILDCTDNFASKFLINDACVGAGKPFVFAGIGSFYGQIMTCVPGQSACCRCVFGGEDTDGELPEDRRGGVIGALCGVMGSLQAMEAIKYLAGIGELLTDRLLTYDALTAEFSAHGTVRRRDCGVCGAAPALK